MISDWGVTISDWGVTISDWGVTISDWGVTISDWGVMIGEWELPESFPEASDAGGKGMRSIHGKGGVKMPKDYIPANDNQLLDWATNFVTKLDLYLETFGLAGGDVTAIGAANTAFTNTLTAHKEQQTAASRATRAKNIDRAALVELCRSMARRVNNHPAMTDAIRADLGLNVPSSGVATVGADVEVPDIFLESLPGKVIVHFGTTPANEQLNGKPAWAKGCNVYRKRSGEEDYTLLAFETSSPYIDYVQGSAADYTYIVRYRGTRASDLGGESSPMTIAASGLLAA